jgi:hypothetical protein
MKRTTFASFEALLAHMTSSRGTVLAPRDGEIAGDPCPQCKEVPRYRADAKGRMRIEMHHGPHATATSAADVELAPPTRTDWQDVYD